jgi:hypothetical protein
VTKAGEYWVSGHEVIEKDKPGRGYGVPLTAPVVINIKLRVQIIKSH